MTANQSPVLAVDIGGTKLAAALVTGSGAILRRDVVPAAPTDVLQRDALWQRLLALMDSVVQDDDVSGVGVGCGGPMRWPSGEVSPLNIPAWRNFPLRQLLSERFSGVPVRVHNDAVAMAIGEHWQGVGRTSEALLGVVVSTGVGGGLILGGQVVHGATGNAGHLGHVVVEPDGPACACGGRGCLEAIARGPAVVAWAVGQGWQPPPGTPADGHALGAAAHAGDPIAIAAFARAGNALGVALASVAHLLELDTVAVGGGLASVGSLLLGPAQAAFERHARLDFAAACRILPAALGGDAGLVGAAGLVTPGLDYWGH